MKTILVPVDFTEIAKNALDYAVEFSKHIQGRILLFHAFHIPASVNEAQVLVISVDELEKTNLERLRELEEYVYKKTGGTVKTESIVRAAFAVDEILNLTEERQIDLIIMGISGGNKLTELIIGSNATETLRKSKVPVLIIPRDVKFKKPEKIVFASNMHETTEKVLEPLMELVKAFNAHLMVVNVLQNREISTPKEAIAGIKLDHILDGIEHSFYFPVNEHVVDGVNDFATKHGAGLIVMIPHKHSIWYRLTHEGKSKKMAFHTHIPLLTLPEFVKESVKVPEKTEE